LRRTDKLFPAKIEYNRIMSPNETWIGVISDTHGLVRPQALQALEGMDYIIHAGDVGAAEILDRLQEIAPLTVVRGNVDRGEWADRLPYTETLQAGGVWFYVLHDLASIPISPTGFDLVISGHTHKPDIRRKSGTLYLNPGSAGMGRFHQPATLARIKIVERAVSAEIVQLEP
jgi:putative phosphoesterase